MKEISIFEKAGSFAENKDIARNVRTREITPALERDEEVILNFAGVEAATQSFVHALIADVLRSHGPAALDRIAFKSCNDTIKKIIGIVAEYMQEGLE
ncbi:MAG: STAS-like domain-containing protein [Elusimicrobia bacterium]|nr:STAS-like domain-containing protein [Elusimicrobiota bacterium]